MKQFAERILGNIIYYTAETIAGVHVPTSKVARKFTKIKETMKRNRDGGSIKEEMFCYYGYYPGDGTIKKIEEDDIILPSIEITLETARRFKKTY